jgi:hypothetical protein
MQQTAPRPSESAAGDALSLDGQKTGSFFSPGLHARRVVRLRSARHAGAILGIPSGSIDEPCCFSAAASGSKRRRGLEQRHGDRALVTGWAGAAREIAPEQTSMIDDWLERRLAHVDAGRSCVVVGHDDLAAWAI